MLSKIKGQNLVVDKAVKLDHSGVIHSNGQDRPCLALQGQVEERHDSCSGMPAFYVKPT